MDMRVWVCVSKWASRRNENSSLFVFLLHSMNILVYFWWNIVCYHSSTIFPSHRWHWYAMQFVHFSIRMLIHRSLASAKEWNIHIRGRKHYTQTTWLKFESKNTEIEFRLWTITKNTVHGDTARNYSTRVIGCTRIRLSDGKLNSTKIELIVMERPQPRECSNTNWKRYCVAIIIIRNVTTDNVKRMISNNNNHTVTFGKKN